MRLSLLAAVLFVITTVVKCKPAVVQSKVLETETLSFSIIASPPVESASVYFYKEAQAVGPVPIISPKPKNESDPISEEPVEQPVIKPTEDLVDQREEFRSMITEEELAVMDEIRASANGVGPCTTDLKVKCNAFYTTDGTICSSSSTGVHCNTRNGMLCSDDAVEACYDFTDEKGLYCSNGSCAMYVTI